MAVTDTPKHANLPSEPLPVGATAHSKRDCAHCPQNGQTGHHSCRYWTLAATPATNYRISIGYLRHLQWLLSYTADSCWQMEGSQSGYLFNASYAYNAADSITWNIISVSDAQMTLARPDGSDPRNILLYAYRYAEAETGLYNITGGGSGTLQPDDEVEFLAPSCLAQKRRPSIERIVSVDTSANTITVELDQDVTEAQWPGEGFTSIPEYYQCKTWRSFVARDWQPVIPGSPFQGNVQRRRLTAAEVQALNGCILLTDSARQNTAIADYKAAVEGERSATFIAKALRSDAREWEDITSTIVSGARLFVQPLDAGSYKTSVYLSGTNLLGAAVADLTETYMAFRFTYIALATADEITRKHFLYVGHKRCRYSVRDYSQSVNNFSAPDGTATDSAGRHWYCAKRKFPESVEVVDPSTGLKTLQTTYSKASGLTNGHGAYPSDGMCMMYGTCNQYSALDTQDMGTEPFSVARTYARVWKQLLWDVDWCWRQIIPGVASHLNIRFIRIGAPGFHWLHGIDRLSTPAGMHEQTWFPANGGYGLGEYETYTYQEEVPEGSGTFITHTRMRAKRSGSAYDSSHDMTTVTWGTPSTYPCAGHYPATVTNYQDKHDPLNYSANLDSSTDPTSSARFYDERSGYGVEADAGTISGMGFHAYSRVPDGDESVLGQKCDLSLLDTEQDKGDCTFERLSTPYTLLGKTISGKIVVNPLRQDEKTAETAATGTIHSVTSLGSNKYRIVIENAPHYNSYVYDRADVVNLHYAGGSFVALDSWAKISDYYESDKVLGNVTRKAWRGLTVQIDGTAGDLDLSDLRFVIEDARACAADQAPDWGHEWIIRSFTPDGYWEADTTATYLQTDDDIGDLYGAVEHPSATVAVEATDSATSISLTAAMSIGNSAVLKCARTGEYMLVSTYTAPSGGGYASIGVARGQFGSTAAALQVNDTLQWILVLDNSTHNPSKTKNTAATRPRTLDSGQYWLAPENRIYFSPSDAGYSYEVRYSVQGKSDSYTSSTGNTVSSYAEFVTDVDWSESSNPCTLYYTRTADASGVSGYDASEGLSKVSGAPSVGQFALFESAGKIGVRLNLNDAGRPVRLEIDKGTTAGDPGDVAGIPEYSTGQGWGRKRDYVDVIDEAGYLAQAGSAAVGLTINARRCEGAWYPASTQKVQVVAFGSAAWVDMPAADYVLEHGRGIVHLTETGLQAIEATYGTEVCFKL